MVVDEQGNEDESKPLLWSERTSLLTKCLTEPTLLEMYENTVYQDLAENPITMPGLEASPAAAKQPQGVTGGRRRRRARHRGGRGHRRM